MSPDQDLVAPCDQARPETLCGKRIISAPLTAPPPEILDRFSLCGWSEDQASLLRAMLDDPDLWRFMYEDYPGAITLDAARSIIALSREASRHTVRAVQFDGQIIGQVRMQWSAQRTPPQSGELSYWLGRAHWGQRLAAPMVALFTWRCLSIYPALTRITARVHRENIPSLNVLKRLGWTVIGTQGVWISCEHARGDALDWPQLHDARALSP
ncbi:MAG: N-acetyltransferase [Rhodobacteraceae bacterium]|nr:MAG: N-acetyltransferase [Paracoccaceae bacterium]